MNPRTQALSAAVVVLVGLLLVLSGMSVPYVSVSPGPTVNVLGESGDTPVIEIDGTRTYPTTGELRLTTVSVTRPESDVTLLSALETWVDRDEVLLPYEVMYPQQSSDEEEQANDAAEMVSSQDTAAAAALTALDYDLNTYAEVVGIAPDGPSEGRLEARDEIVSIDGKPTADLNEVLKSLDGVAPGEAVTVVVRRAGERRAVEVTTGPAPIDPSRAALGIQVGVGFDFPFTVRLGVQDIGGPSAGLMFSLGVYDLLTPGALADDHVVAGTGTITVDGQVGPIGGIAQKIAAAREAGADLFLVPPGNCEASLDADPGDMRLVEAPTLSSAVESLETFTQDPDADLPRCAA